MLKLQQDLRRRRCATCRSCVVGGKERLHQTLAPASVSVLRWRRPIDLVALDERREERSRFYAAVFLKERSAGGKLLVVSRHHEQVENSSALQRLAITLVMLLEHLLHRGASL